MVAINSSPVVPFDNEVLFDRFTRRATVLLRGEHDAANSSTLAETLAGAIAVDGVTIAIDLSQVEFMGAATVHVIVRAREFLERRGRSLELLSPSRCARRVLEVCAIELLDTSRYEPGFAFAEVGMS